MVEGLCLVFVSMVEGLYSLVSMVEGLCSLVDYGGRVMFTG